MVASVVFSGVLGLSGCATPPATGGAKSTATSAPSPAYLEMIAAAEEFQKQGNNAEALARYESAAKADPAKKQPWVRMAQVQFDARNYGAAITAAQEALQRDTADITSQSILAVSGLRVSAAAIEQLRKANAIAGSTRGEAQALARTLRESLGESILPANAAPATAPGNDAAAAKPAATRPAYVRRPVVVAPRAAAVSASAPVAAAPVVRAPVAAAPVKAPVAAAPAVQPAKRNPFDALK